jgi:hypothetical protein
MKTSIRLCLFCALAVFSFGCKDDDEFVRPDSTFSFDFEQSAEGWEAGVADFPKDWDQSQLEFEFSHDALPAEVDEEGMALQISGRNISDDLFMFVKKQVTGLEPNHTYRVTFQVELASKYPEQFFGIGGSPGASVYLKAGGAAIEPMPVEEGNYISMNIDKGNQSEGGENMVVLGHIGIPGEEETYQLIRRDNLQHPIQITTDSNGSMWLLVGTDSGFEGTTTLYYNTIEVELKY